MHELAPLTISFRVHVALGISEGGIGVYACDTPMSNNNTSAMTKTIQGRGDNDGYDGNRDKMAFTCG